MQFASAASFTFARRTNLKRDANDRMVTLECSPKKHAN